ncbi:MAG TPA: CpsB/CapC family capsule biosynthesis tyrosine phosphatase [Solirubrobacterales bacterium]
MIDLHCHILPGIDDGATDLDDAAAMASQAEGDGIQSICATPHIRHDHRVPIDELEERVAAVNEELEQRRIGVTVLAGGEVAETRLPELDAGDLRAVALGGGNWILLEPAPGPLSDSLDGAVRELSAAGFGALIAHPERHLDARAHLRLARLVQRGALVQATAAFFEHPEAAPAMLDLARHGLVHVLGSDSHSAAHGRPVRLSPAIERIGAVESLRRHLGWIAEEAPRGIVQGKAVLTPFRPN